MSEYHVLIEVTSRLLPYGIRVVAFNKELAVVEAVILLTTDGKLTPGSFVKRVETRLMRRI